MTIVVLTVAGSKGVTVFHEVTLPGNEFVPHRPHTNDCQGQLFWCCALRASCREAAQTFCVDRTMLLSQSHLRDSGLGSVIQDCVTFAGVDSPGELFGLLRLVTMCAVTSFDCFHVFIHRDQDSSAHILLQASVCDVKYL